MLASPATDADEAFTYFEHAQVEDKDDGIRAQAHCGGGVGMLFSRTLDEVTSSFPELVAPLGGLAGEFILDGEIVACAKRMPMVTTLCHSRKFRNAWDASRSAPR